MTEDDTFRKLRQQPLVDAISYYSFLTNGLITFGEFERKLDEYGWTWSEFELEYLMK